MATSESALAPLWGFLGRTSNIVGGAAAVVTMVGTEVLIGQPLIAVGLGVLGYGAGFLLSSSKKQQLTLGAMGDQVEISTIQTNIAALKATMDQHSGDLPAEIVTQTRVIFEILDDILPRWERLDSFSQDKYTINAIVAEYLPQAFTQYLNLPRSYYRHDAKTLAAQRILEQIEILHTVLVQISDRLYSDIEQGIAEQGAFLRDKFNTGNSLQL